MLYIMTQGGQIFRGIFWWVLLVAFFALSSGWLYALAIKNFKNQKRDNFILCLMIAIVVDFLASMAAFNGVKNMAVHGIYVFTGLIAFALSFLVERPSKNDQTDS